MQGMVNDSPATRGSRRRLALVAGLVVVMGLVVGAVLVVRSTSESNGVVPGGSLDARSGIRATPGLRSRVEPAQAALGDQIYVYGGRSPDVALAKGGLLGDNALVDPATGDVRRLSPPPFDAPLWDADALVVRGRILLVGRECTVGSDFDPDSELVDPDCRPGTYAAAVLDVERDAWTRLSIPESLRAVRGANAIVRALGVTTDGRAVLGLGDVDRPEIWTVAGDVWSNLPDAGIAERDGCLAGDRVVLLSTSDHGADGYAEPRVAVLDLGGPGPWRQSPAVDGVQYRASPPRVVCLGHQAMVVDRNGLSPDSTARFDLSSLQPLPVSKPSIGAAMPTWAGRSFDGSVWTGEELVFLPIPIEPGSPTLSYRPSSDSWRTFSGLPAISKGAVWSGSAMVGYADAVPWLPEPDARPMRSAGGVFRFVVPTGQGGSA